MARVLESAEKNPVSYPLSTAFIFCFSWGPQSSVLSPGEKRKKSHKSIAPILALVCQLQSKCTERQRKADAFPLKGWLCVSQSLVLKYVSLLGCCFSSCHLNRSSGALGWKQPPGSCHDLQSLGASGPMSYEPSFLNWSHFAIQVFKILVLLGAYSNICPLW